MTLQHTAAQLIAIVKDLATYHVHEVNLLELHTLILAAREFTLDLESSRDLKVLAEEIRNRMDHEENER